MTELLSKIDDICLYSICFDFVQNRGQFKEVLYARTEDPEWSLTLNLQKHVDVLLKNVSYSGTIEKLATYLCHSDEAVEVTVGNTLKEVLEEL
jgi:hypothetical protein